MTKVVIYVEGGNVQSVHSNDKDIHVVLVDADNMTDQDGMQDQECADAVLAREIEGLTEVLIL